MAFLQITSDDADKARRFEFDRDEITVGRAEENVISLDDPAVSGKHCVVLRDGPKYTLRDLGATNTTRLNNVRITESRLKPKDIILVGSVAIMFDGDDVEVDESVSIHSGATRLTVVPGSTVAQMSIDDSSPFQTKPDTRWKWIGVIAVLAVIALAAGGWFVLRLILAD